MASWRELALCGTAFALLVSPARADTRPVADPWTNVAERHAPAAPSSRRIRVSTPQLDAVTRTVLRRFDAAGWERSVRLLADNGGTHSRYAWRVRDAKLLNGHPAPDAAADMAADWISEELQSYGYAATEQVFPFHVFAGGTRAATFHMRNIIAERTAVGGEAAEIILVTAHYDSKASRSEGWESAWRDMAAPGANDNATGVATVLELARLLADARLNRTVRFAFFSGEEQGLIGSRHYAHAMRQADEDIAAVINIDMIGYDSDGLYDLHVVADGQSRWLLDAIDRLRRLVDSRIALQPRVEPGFTFSDHAPFWWEGYSAVYVSEESDPRPAERHPTYHTSEDTPEHVNFEYGAAAARLIAGIVALLAEPHARAGPDALPSGDGVQPLSVSAYPNPYAARSGETLNVQYHLEDAVDVRAEVYTTNGRRVRRFRPIATAGPGPIAVWDGSTQDGSAAPPGVYFVRVEARDRNGIRHRGVLRVLVTP